MLDHRFTGLIAIALGVAFSPSAHAFGNYFTNRCAPCHFDDTVTCDGCHHHRGTLSAATDQDEYHPGDPIVVTLDGGAKRSGWIRAVLYDDQDVEIAIASGPSGTGDDGLGDAVLFPAELNTFAPESEGDYIWTATWFGAESDGSGHVEEPVSVQIHVTNPVGITTHASWGALKAAKRR
jgi:hypothetical protein